MAISSTDVKIRLSIKTGSQGNSLAQTDPNASLGKWISQTDWLGGTIHDLFALLGGDENAGSESRYRCVFVYNAHANLTLTGVTIWFDSQVAGGADASIGLDPTAASVVAATVAQALSVADEKTAPTGVTFSAPTTKPTGIVLGDIPAGRCRAFWIKRKANNTAALNNDGAVLKIEGDSAA